MTGNYVYIRVVIAGRRMSMQVSRTSTDLGRRMSTARRSIAKQSMSKQDSERSNFSDQVVGAILDSPKVHLLHLLNHELEYIIESDILPRWKRNTEEVHLFLLGEPPGSGTPAV